jgi:hypothetical protein
LGFTANVEMAITRDLAHVGDVAQQVQAQAFTLEYLPKVPVQAPGYHALRFAFHPGDSEAGARPAFGVMLNGDSPSMVSLVDGDEVAIDMTRRQWQVVEIPLARFYRLDGPIVSLRLLGNLRGTFYLDDMRLVAAPLPAQTAVLEEQQLFLPEQLSLQQNYPNPFNSGTVIDFTLPFRQSMQLEVFNTVGQRVAVLASGERAAGHYRLRWDGRNDLGQVLASGVYFYRLRTRTQVEIKKLLLLR